MAGIEMTHVPYRGAGPAMNDLLPGRVSVMFSNLPGVMPQVQSKTVRGLGITAAKRIAAAPDIPTIGETVPGYEVATWWGMFAPARTPADVIEKIRADTDRDYYMDPQEARSYGMIDGVRASRPGIIAAPPTPNGDKPNGDQP